MGFDIQVVAKRVGFTIVRGARLYRVRTANTEILSLLYPYYFFLHTAGSGITFILFATIFCFGNRCGSFFCWGGVTGNSFICWSLVRVGRAVGITFICDYQERARDKVLVIRFILRTPLLTPSSSERWTLSRTAWRGRRASLRSLRAPYRRPEPFTRCVWAL